MPSKPGWLPSIPYPVIREQDGYWVPITSTLDWCEENYYATNYSAEIVNAVTNLIFVFFAFKGMYNCLKYGHDRIFFITFFGYLLTGLGSFAFHSTLKYPMQLVDELSMIYTTCLMFWASFSLHRRRAVQVVLGVGVFALALFITLYYHYLQDPQFHQDAYALLTAIVLIRSMVVMELHMRPHFSRRRQQQQQHENQNKSTHQSPEQHRHRHDEARDREILRRMWWLIAFGLTVFLGGFGIWNLDNRFCSTLRAWRRDVGLPWGILLEGHGWWHLMTGLGAYCYIVWGIWLRHCLNGRHDEFELVWPSMFLSLPRIVAAEEVAKEQQQKTKKSQ